MTKLFGKLLLTFFVDSIRCGRRSTADRCNIEDGLPGLEGLAFSQRGVGVAETGVGKGTLCPPVVDVCYMPFDTLRGGVAVKLVADINEILDGGCVNVVDT